MTTREILVEARELITPTSRWTAGSFARDKWLAACNPHSPDATRFCAHGALERVVNDPITGFLTIDPIMGELWMTIEELWPNEDRSVASINDHYGHSAILQLFDKTIERLNV